MVVYLQDFECFESLSNKLKVHTWYKVIPIILNTRGVHLSPPNGRVFSRRIVLFLMQKEGRSHSFNRLWR